MKILHFADFHLGVENYGRTDPATGLSSRLGDFLSALDKLVDYAIGDKIDLVLFCGDAYKTREPSPTQQREFARRINRLATAGIPVFLLVGNHDLPNAVGRATATEIFSTLAVPHIYVSGRPDISKIPTAGGTVQIVSLPWLRRSPLLSREESRDLSFDEIKERLQQALTQVIAEKAAALDSSLPAIMAAHVAVVGARGGSENLMIIGQEHSVLLSSIALPAFDYVALGHIHKYQVLQPENPPVVYAGSLERVDFGEENDEKGFCVVEITTDASGHRHTAFAFHPLSGRRFLTIDVALEAEDGDPTGTVLQAIAAQGDRARDAVVRLNISQPEQLAGLRDGEIRSALKEAHNFTIARDIRRETRLRLGNSTAETIAPLAALKAWLDAKQVAPEQQKTLLEYGEKLIQGEKAP
jgi:exonuclease SbcD